MHGTHRKETDQQSLLELYREVRLYTETLCKPLETEDYVIQAAEFASPPKWNIAHTTWFFEEMILKKYLPDYREFNPDFGFLFNSYYETLGSRIPRNRRGDISRPTVEQVFDYRQHVDEKMQDLIITEQREDVRRLIALGLNHEQQHQELFLTDLKFNLSVNPLNPVYLDGFALCEQTDQNENGVFIGVEGGIFEIGYAGDGFHFDNERENHKVLLPDFEIADHLVTNGEFLDFVEDGGYRDVRLWHSEGWDWVRENNAAAPLYWSDGEQFTLAGRRKIDPLAPVCHLSFFEAAAFAEWSGRRLPTEFEWEAASGQFDWGLRWEWTNSAYLPYPNFKTAAGAVGEYNGKFMINQMVLRGASVATPSGHSRKTYRNFFHPHLNWQFTGLRLAK